jgi:hypothetical protein
LKEIEMQVGNEDFTLSEGKLQSRGDVEYKAQLERYFEESIGGNVEKLNNFCKFVPRQALTRFLAKYEIFKKILCVQGSIVECGVFLGGGMMTWAQLSSILEPVNFQRKIIGFDTFSGISQVGEKDTTSDSTRCREGGLSIDSFEDLKECVQIYDLNRNLNHIPKVELIKGDIKDTVPSYLDENPHTVVSLLYLDVVVYEPTLLALRKFKERIPKGGVIVFDELNSKQWPGETIAVLEEIGISNLSIQRLPFDSVLSYAVV